ncbi:MAG: lipoate--protein ligase [Firmicutes bacterium]|nr:lipoate--protein ligase [Bacillota bacterium]
MSLRTKIICSDSFDPTYNLALEEYLTHNAVEGEITLYLWQNERTVVIGKNQNYWAEVNAPVAEADGVTVVRRLSGGGAVFHDLGNMNFTFIVRKEDYDVDRQLSVIVEALAEIGIKAEKTGRNDITAEGRKFSGNAFYKSDSGWYHHGTLMVDVDKEKLGAYLNVSQSKLQSKGVKSVKSRVINLKELREDLTLEMLKDALFDAFARIYGSEATRIDESEIDWAEVKKLRERYNSWEWTKGRKLPFTVEHERRFDWGNIDLQLEVEGGIIKDAVCYSDAMNENIGEGLAAALVGREYVEGEAFWTEISKMVTEYDI